MVVAIKICFFQFLIVWAIPITPPIIAWTYVVFCVFAYEVIVRWSE